MRINKFIAACGIASRRKAEELIKEGKISLNGEVVNELSINIDPEKDKVFYNGEEIRLENEEKVYFLLNKPEGYISSAKDQFDRKSVVDLIKTDKRIYPVGRLDYETSGLLILTNDGDLTYKLTHPKHEVEKTYIASVRGIPDELDLESFRNGLEIDDYVSAKAKIGIVKKDKVKNYSVCKISIHEGHNRQVRKMLEKIGHPAMNLKRISMGNIKLNDLKSGEYRPLSRAEVEYLKNIK